MKARIFLNNQFCGILEKHNHHHYTFTYDDSYKGNDLSLTLPKTQKLYTFEMFPAFFDGLLPEGMQLEALLRSHKLDADDYMGQLLLVGADLVGAVTVLPESESQ